MVQRGVWYDESRLREALDGATTVKQVLERLGVSPQAANYSQLKEACIRYDLIAPSSRRRMDGFNSSEILEFVQASDSLNEVLGNMGLAGNTRHRNQLLERCEEYGIPVEHLVKRSNRWSEDSLAVACGRYATKSSVLRSLGLSVSSKTYSMLDEKLNEYGLAITGSEAFSSGIHKLSPGAWKVAKRRQLLEVAPTVFTFKELYDRLDLPIEYASSLDWMKKEMSAHGVELGKKDMLKELSENSSLSRASLKMIVVKHGLVDSSSCAVCGIEPMWNGKPLVFHLDHIDGNNRNNLISNLRFLCPNCHSQTETYCR